MKLTLQGIHLQKKLPLLTHAISSRSQLPILLHILLETNQNRVYMSATDLEIGVETDLPAIIEEEGGVVIPARLFIELIGSLSSDKIVLQTKGNSLEILSNTSKSELVTMSKDEFPVLFEERGELLAKGNVDALQKNLSRVVFATSTDTTRPSLSGVLMKKTEKGFLLVATDGYRLSLQQGGVSGVEGESEALKSIIIPARIIREVIGFKESNDIAMYISRKNNQVLFFQEETALVGRLIEAEFPNYEKIIPVSYSTRVFFNREELYKAVKVCALFAREAGNIVKLAITGNGITVSANSPSVGENIVAVESKLEGEEKEIAFNAKYLLDLFANIEEEQMVLEMTGPLNPGVFKIVGDDSFLHLIMPIRTQG